MSDITKLESYYLSKPEPYQSCLLALKDMILGYNDSICHERKFQIPFFTYKDKKLGYLWLNQRKLMLGFCMDKSLLEFEPGVKPKDRYESIRIDTDADLPRDYIIERLSYYINCIDNGNAGYIATS